MTNNSLFWIARRDGQDHHDEDISRAIALLTNVIPEKDWAERLNAIRMKFEQGKRAWAEGRVAQLFDPLDAIGWYIFQANAYISCIADWYEPEAFRIVPVFKRLGQCVEEFKNMPGAMVRVHTLMTKGRSQPDDGIFELLVAAAYKRRSWEMVEFVPEQRGIAKTQDLLVTALDGTKWGVECKRVNRSAYELLENQHASNLAEHVHELCRNSKRSVILEVSFEIELAELPEHYLAQKVEAFFADENACEWDEEFSIGRVRNVNWTLTDAVLRHDDLFFGSSRMVELLVGEYAANMDYSISGDWVPSQMRPLHSTSMSRACVIGWLSASPNAVARKASHFRALVGKAAKQLPLDCPGVVHVGYEARVGNSADEERHYLNASEIADFDATGTQLKWVYGNYFASEHTTARNEAWAIIETTATYLIGNHDVQQPLPQHLLFSDGSGHPGHRW